jgi:hypothetical protein
MIGEISGLRQSVRMKDLLPLRTLGSNRIGVVSPVVVRDRFGESSVETSGWLGNNHGFMQVALDHE